MTKIGLVLTQIASQHSIGFSQFEVIEGLRGPVAVLLNARTQPWRGIQSIVSPTGRR